MARLMLRLGGPRNRPSTSKTVKILLRLPPPEHCRAGVGIKHVDGTHFRLESACPYTTGESREWPGFERDRRQALLMLEFLIVFFVFILEVVIIVFGIFGFCFLGFRNTVHAE